MDSAGFWLFKEPLIRSNSSNQVQLFVNKSKMSVLKKYLVVFKMKIATILLFVLFVSSCAASKESSGCQDFLVALNLKPPELTFQRCKKIEKPPAILLESTYAVSGKHAKTVEDFLHKEFGLAKLRFVCCGWEGREATYVSKSGDTYSINMHSYDEYSFQEKWQDYKKFRVTVGKYIVLPWGKLKVDKFLIIILCFVQASTFPCGNVTIYFLALGEPKKATPPYL